MDRKNKLIDLLDALQDKQAWIWSMMDDEQRDLHGTDLDWAPKDHLAHANFWTEQVITKLNIALGGETLERLEDYKKTNEETFELFKDQSWQEIHLWSERVHGALIEALGQFTTDALEDTERFEWTNHRPLWNDVVFTAVYHRVQHAGDILHLCGMPEYVTGIQQQFAIMMEQMDDSDEWRGTTRYNLACYYALDGKPEAAIGTLADAFDLNPGLVAWAKQDSDLDSLRELAGFQALLGES